jgi:hypothetical protein
VFTPADRERARGFVLDFARADERVIGAMVTGSGAVGEDDRWSDVDLFLGVSDDGVMADLTRLVYGELGAVHHWDLPFREATYRVFLLANGLEVDVAFAPPHAFGAHSPRFRVVFGEAVEQDSVPPPALDDLAGHGWHHLLHARTSIERGRLWQAEHWISAARDLVITLACLRLGQRTAYAKGAHTLPPEVTAPLEGALVRSLDPDELRRALGVATERFLAELAEAEPELAERLAGPLGDLSSS